MTLRQFWQLARDCNFVDEQCDIADINRIVVFSSRETHHDRKKFVKHMDELMGGARHMDAGAAIS